MADKSLDEIIAAKGHNFKVQFQNSDGRKKFPGKIFQQGGPGRQGFPSNKNRFPGPQKRPFSAPAQQQKQGVAGPRMQSHANSGSLAGPGKGQIDARDMITIKNRIKIPDARAKIIQKRLQKGNFDARSKLRPKSAPGIQNQPGRVSEGQPPGLQQVKLFQQPPQPGQQPSQQYQQPPSFQNQLPPQFQQPPPQFQQLPPQFRQPPPQFQQPPPFQEPPSQFQEPELGFQEHMEYQELLEYEEAVEYQEVEYQPTSPDYLQLQPDIEQQQQQPPMFQQPPPPFQQNRPPFQQPPSQFQQRPPCFQHPPPQVQQQQQQQPPPRFQFQQPPTRMQQPLAQQNRGGLIDFPKASVNTNMAPGPGSAPTITRTLVNPLASGGALVEDTGSSLKITRAIPDVTFDGSNLTVTRRLPPNQEALQGNGQAPRINMDSNKGPVIQIRNEKFRPQPIQPPGAGAKSRPTANPVMAARSQPQAVGSTRPTAKPFSCAPSQPVARTPIQPPSQSHAQSASSQSTPAPSTFSASAGNSRYKYTSTAASARTETSLESQGRLKPPPALAEPPRRPAQSALARIQMQAQAEASPARGVSAMKRLAPATTYSPQQTTEMSVPSMQKAGVKRKAPLTLSERFASGNGGGNPIPVITDHAPKKRRAPAPVPVEPVGEEFVEDFELKEQFEEEEEDPAPTLLSPLQGFCIRVSNLHSSVTQDDIIELFGAVGPLKRANLLQRGQAEVAFIYREDAVMALKKYHNRELDGQPMFVKLVTPLDAKVMKAPASAEENAPALPPALRTSKKPAEAAAPVEIPLIHKALFKTGSPTPGKSVRFTVKI